MHAADRKGGGGVARRPTALLICDAATPLFTTDDDRGTAAAGHAGQATARGQNRKLPGPTDAGVRKQYRMLGYAYERTFNTHN